ncbi:MAG: sugar phosphate isomerase/epimerase family protein [Minisyncoccota bacterium]
MQFGIMQGRLSPSQGQELQFFPKNWESEFEVARTLGFKTIEWIFDSLGNPLLVEAERIRMREISMIHGVHIKSICADIFMKEHLIIESSPAVHQLVKLLKLATLTEIPLVVIPFVEDNLPDTDRDLEVVAENLRTVIDLDQGKVDIALEVDLPTDRILSLVEAIGSPRVGVCYDTGNAMTFGFDAGDDIRKLGQHLKEIHIKDRIVGTRQSVYLGEGSVNFRDVFAALHEVSFDGFHILQTWRGEDYLSDAKRQMEFVLSHLKRTKGT